MKPRKPIPKDALRKQLFAALYVGACRLNGVEAARQAGYQGNPNTLAARASKLLADADVKKTLAAHAEAVEFTQREVLSILGRHARGTMEDFVSFDGDDEPHLDLRKAKEAKRLHLLKKFKEKRNTVTMDGKGGDAELISETVTYEIELYDAQAAAVQLGRILGMYVEQFRNVAEPPPGDMSDEEWVAFYLDHHMPPSAWIPGIRRLYEAGRIVAEGGAAKPVASRVLGKSRQ